MVSPRRAHVVPLTAVGNRDAFVWPEVLRSLPRVGTVEYGIYQRDAVRGTPIWRRPVRGKRFETISAALFGKQGARNACRGTAPYAKERYAATNVLAVPYAATWLRGSAFALLVRSSTPHPEVTLVPSTEVHAIDLDDEGELTDYLSELFGTGARLHGVLLLADNESIIAP